MTTIFSRINNNNNKNIFYYIILYIGASTEKVHTSTKTVQRKYIFRTDEYKVRTSYVPFCFSGGC